MTAWEKTELSVLLTQRKEPVTLAPAARYSLVTISTKGQITLRERKLGADISADKGYTAKAGDFIYSRLAIHSGAFGIVPPELDNAFITAEMPCFAIDTSRVYPQVLIDMMKLPDFSWQLRQLIQGAGRVRVKENMFLSLTLKLPPMAEQKVLMDRIKRFKESQLMLSGEIATQQTLLKKLRQQILQEAVEGKISTDWRKQNAAAVPAAETAVELLARIRAEKAALIKQKKLKPQNPLPPISSSERPFPLPKGWAWCRLGEVMLMHYGKGLKKSDTHLTGKYPVYGSNGIVGYYNSCLTEKQAIIIGRKGSAGAIQIASNGSWATDVSYYIEEDKNLNFMYQIFLLQSLKLEKLSKGLKPGLNREEFYSQIFSLPPLAEQEIIVKKVEAVLTLCTQLEQQIDASRQNAARLMPSILTAAFAKAK